MNARDDKPGLTAKELQDFSVRLREIRDRLIGEVDRELDGIREDLNAAGNLSSVPIHLGDNAPSQLDADITVMENERRMLQLTHEAIERIAEGTFGVCEECGNRIPRERLEELPFTPYCFDCASRLERQAPSFRADRPGIGERRNLEFPADGQSDSPTSATGDRYAAGTPGGGTAAGGLGGINMGHGDVDDLDVISNALGSGSNDQNDDWIDEGIAEGGRSGGGTPAGKRAGRRPKE